MAPFNKFNVFTENLCEKVHDLDLDTLKVMLSNTAPLATNSVKADLTEIAAGNGYPAGGVDIQNDWSETTGTATATATQSWRWPKCSPISWWS